MRNAKCCKTFETPGIFCKSIQPAKKGKIISLLRFYCLFVLKINLMKTKTYRVLVNDILLTKVSFFCDEKFMRLYDHLTISLKKSSIIRNNDYTIMFWKKL
jgi:hypothetical protein